MTDDEIKAARALGRDVASDALIDRCANAEAIAHTRGVVLEAISRAWRALEKEVAGLHTKLDAARRANVELAAELTAAETERGALKHALAAMTAARDEACKIAVSWIGDATAEVDIERIAALRAVGEGEP